MKIHALRRLGLAGLVFIALGGPTPGAIGSCNDDVQVADPVKFCEKKKSYTCLREFARGDIAIHPSAPGMCNGAPDREACEREASRNICLGAVEGECASVTWGTDCEPPNTIQADACINALKAIPRLAEATASIVECRPEVLCPPFEETP